MLPQCRVGIQSSHCYDSDHSGADSRTIARFLASALRCPAVRTGSVIRITASTPALRGRAIGNDSETCLLQWLGTMSLEQAYWQGWSYRRFDHPLPCHPLTLGGQRDPSSTWLGTMSWNRPTGRVGQTRRMRMTRTNGRWQDGCKQGGPSRSPGVGSTRRWVSANGHWQDGCKQGGFLSTFLSATACGGPVGIAPAFLTERREGHFMRSVLTTAGCPV